MSGIPTGCEDPRDYEDKQRLYEDRLCQEEQAARFNEATPEELKLWRSSNSNTSS